jgi:hypothetical protein
MSNVAVHGDPPRSVSAVRPLSPDREELVRAAALAPSPDNNQPWQFFHGDAYIDVGLDASRCLPSDVNSMFDLTALGAALENLAIAASEQEFEVRVEFLSRSGAANGVARASWSPGAEPDRLFPFLRRRHTSRRFYARTPVRAAVLDELALEASGTPGVQIHWLKEREEIDSFARIVGKSDRLRFESQAFHQELFRQLRFKPSEAAATRDGLDLRALDLPPFGWLALRIIQNWRLLAFANRFWASGLLAWPSAQTVKRSGAIGLLTVDEPSAVGFFRGGRAFQRLWLAATAQGLQLHPLGSLPIFLAHLDQLNGEQLSPAQRRLAQQVKLAFGEIAPEAAGRTLQIAFRLGYGPGATFRSLRRSISDLTSTSQDSALEENV